jgi:hypothetical protein
MTRVSVRNTFLDLDGAEDEKFLAMGRRRAKSDCLKLPSVLTSLEQTTVNHLNALLECSSYEDSAGRDQQAQSKPMLQSKLSKLKNVLSSSSVSTMAPEDWDCEDVAMKESASFSHCGEFAVESQDQRAVLTPACSSSSISSMVSMDGEHEGDHMFYGNSHLLQERRNDTAARNQSQVRWGCNQAGQWMNHGCHQVGWEGQRQDSHVREDSGSGRRGGIPPVKDFTHSRVPRSLNLVEEFCKTVDATPTTMMIRNIPNRYTQRELIEELESLGFAGSFDFFYAPIDFGTMGNVGYAFVNFVSPEWAASCRQHLDGFIFRRHQQRTRKKVATVSVAHLQGLTANIRHYENAAVTGRARSKRCGPVIMTNIASAMS